MRMKTVFCILSALFLITGFHSISSAEGAGITYHGRLVDPNEQPVIRSAVQFRIQLRTPGNENCLLYEEIQLKDLSQTDGVFSVTINDGTGTRTDTSGLGIDKVFANRNTFSFPSGNCAIGTTYTPNPSDGRKIQLLFNDGTFADGQWESAAPMAINFVPMAIEAMQISGYKKEQLLRIADGVPTTGTELSAGDWSALLALVQGTSTQYPSQTSFNTLDTSVTSLTSTVSTLNSSVQSFAKTALPTCTGSQAISSNGTSLSCVTVASSGVSSLTAAATSGNPLVIGGTASAATVDIPAASASVNGYLTSTDFTAFNNKLSSAVLSGKMFVGNGSNVATAVTPSGDVTMDNAGSFSVDKIKGKTVSTPTLAGQVLRYDGTGFAANFVGMTDLRSSVTGSTSLAATCGASQTLTYNSALDNLTCTNIAITGSQVSGNISGTAANVSGTVAPANGGTGSTDGSIVGTSALTIAAGGTNQNVTVSPSGTGATILNGKVGIGTTSPSSALEVTGDIALSAGATRNISIPNSTSGAGTSLTIKAGTGATTGDAGGALTLVAGNGYWGNAGASLTMASSGFSGGSVTLISGRPDINGSAGSTKIQGGPGGANTAGGSVVIKGGTGGSNGAVGGPAYMYGGTPGGANTTYGNVILAHDGTAAHGYVGIGTNSPTSALHVKGAIVSETPADNTSTTIDWSLGNLQTTSASGGAFTMDNIKDGGAYNLIVTDTTNRTFSFTATGLTFNTGANSLTTTGTSKVIFTFLRAGTVVYVTMNQGY